MYTEELFPFAMTHTTGTSHQVDYLFYQMSKTIPEIRESENIPINANINNIINDDYVIINPANTIIPNYFTDSLIQKSPKKSMNKENILDIPNNLDIPDEFDIPRFI